MSPAQDPSPRRTGRAVRRISFKETPEEKARIARAMKDQAVLKKLVKLEEHELLEAVKQAISRHGAEERSALHSLISKLFLDAGLREELEKS
jgi:hypothetical protein